MKYLFATALIMGLASCDTTKKTECCDAHTEDQVDCHETDSTGKFVSDSVYWSNQAYIDSLTNVNELLDYLETIPSTHR